MSWRLEADRLKKIQAKAPQGCKTVKEIAEETEMSEERAQVMVGMLVKEGRAEVVKGKRLNPAGNLIPCTYYRLVGKRK